MFGEYSREGDEPESVILTDAELEEIESQIEHKLPYSYREFLRYCGNFFPSTQLVAPAKDAWGDTEFGTITFLGKRANHRDIVEHYRSYKQRSELPYTCLPIADDPGGNYLCLVLDGPNKDCIICYWHDDEMQVFSVAANFDEFFSSLESEQVFGFYLQTARTAEEILEGLSRQHSSARRDEHRLVVGKFAVSAERSTDSQNDWFETNYNFCPNVFL